MGLIDSIIGAESGGDPNASNPSSSASGLGQFIDSTWLSTLKAHRPDLADGRSDADLIALKSDPQLSREMTGAYAADNQASLAKASVPVTPGSTYLAHFAGPQGAVSVLKADPTTPVGQVLGDSVVRANPFLRNMTAGDLQAWADRKMGGAQTASVSPASPGMAPPQARPPIFSQQQAPQAAQPTAPQAPPDSGTGGYFSQVPVDQIQTPQIYYAPRKAPDLTALRMALANRAPIFPSQG